MSSISEDAFYNCPNLTIYGYSGSIAEGYAVSHDIPFVSLGQAEMLLGDVNFDNDINAQDALLVLQHSVGLKKLYSIAAADVDGNQQADPKDALYILQKTVGLISAFPAEL